MKELIKITLAVAILTGGLALSGCSNAPSEEELKQLNDLKEQVSSLENQIRSLKAEKASIEKLVAEKNGKLQQCQSDQEAVKKGLGQ